jgi:hypothetical protein
VASTTSAGRQLLDDLEQRDGGARAHDGQRLDVDPDVGGEIVRPPVARPACAAGMPRSARRSLRTTSTTYSVERMSAAASTAKRAASASKQAVVEGHKDDGSAVAAAPALAGARARAPSRSMV